MQKIKATIMNVHNVKNNKATAIIITMKGMKMPFPKDYYNNYVWVTYVILKNMNEEKAKH